MSAIKRAVVAVLLFSVSAFAASPDDFVVPQSTAAVKGAKKAAKGMRPKRRYHPIRRMHKTLKAIVPKPIQEIPGRFESGIRQTSPNPKVQQPRAATMPSQSPNMPEGPTPNTEPLPSGADRFFNAAAKIMTKSWKGNIFVWLPAISTDPNAGTTIGILPVLVLADENTHHIRHLLAPSYTYNELFGQTGTMRYYFYPTDTSQLYANASISQHTNRELKVRYENPALRDGLYYWRAEAYYSADGSERFYGLGPNSRSSNETGFVSKDSTVRSTFGVNFAKYWRAAVGLRFRRYATEQNIIPGTIDSATQFPGTPGLGTNNTTSSEFHLLWDTRDTPITPSRGASGEFFAEKTIKDFGSDADYVRYGGEGKKFFLWKDPKQITVFHAKYDYANGPFIPFYESPNLGGRDSLRAYGDRRFVDRGSLVFNVEHRYVFSSLKLMGIQTNFEAAPFIDLGTVFPTPDEIQRKNFRPVYGAAFRAAVKPNVVGDVEVGWGHEGTAVFVDINYPF